MANMFFLGCVSSWNSDGSDGIIYFRSILSVSCARATDRRHRHMQPNLAYSGAYPKIAYYSSAWAVAQAGENLYSEIVPIFISHSLVWVIKFLSHSGQSRPDLTATMAEEIVYCQPSNVVKTD